MGSEKRKGGKGGQGYFRLARKGGGGYFFLVKEVRGDHQFNREVYFKRGPLAKMGKAVK